jgi:DNA-binding winged helix-turn-helix (wHTH) protein
MAHGDRSVDVFVRKLRSKFQQASPDWNYIHTHFGVGYRFGAERAAGAEVLPEPVDGLPQAVAVAADIAPAPVQASEPAKPTPLPAFA